MKLSSVSKGLVLSLALLLAATAFAANKGSLQVGDELTVAGKQLKSGTYTVKWDGTGPNVELNIMKGKDVVATVPAHVVDLSNSPRQDAAVVKMNPDGSRSLAQIRFSGKRQALEINESAAGMSGSSGSSSN